MDALHMRQFGSQGPEMPEMRKDQFMKTEEQARECLRCGEPATTDAVIPGSFSPQGVKMPRTIVAYCDRCAKIAIRGLAGKPE